MKRFMTKRANEAIDAGQQELDAFGLLGQADQIEDESIIFYENLKKMFPQWSNALGDVIDAGVKRKGVIAALRADISGDIAKTFEEGIQEGENALHASTLMPTESEGIDGGIGIAFVESQPKSPEFYLDHDEADEIVALFQD